MDGSLDRHGHRLMSKDIDGTRAAYRLYDGAPQFRARFFFTSAIAATILFRAGRWRTRRKSEAGLVGTYAGIMWGFLNGPRV